MPRDVGVVVVAAGRGERSGRPEPKQFVPIAGTPMLLRAIRPFVRHPDVHRVVVVLPPDALAAPPAWLAPHAGEALAMVAGGARRSDSVRAGLAALPVECRTVLVHDAARPFVARDVIDAALAMARDGHGAVPAIPVTDTLKRADSYGEVLATVARAGLWRAQTPQAFPRDILERAHAAAVAEDLDATDDASLVERLGVRVELVPGSTRNIKVTTPEDFAFAEFLAGHE